MSTVPASAVHPHLRLSVPALRGWGFGALALTWYLASTFAPVGIPSFAAIFIVGLLVMLSVAPDSRWPRRGIAVSRRNVALALLAGIAFVPFAIGMNLLLGRVPIESGPAVLATPAALSLALARLAETREYQFPALLGHRELIVSVAFVAYKLLHGRVDGLKGKLRLTALMLPLVLIDTATHHWGYPQYREDGLRRPETGNVLISIPTFATASPVGSVLEHVSQHVAAVTHAYESRIFNPPVTRS